jgi:hypothetical protein
MQDDYSLYQYEHFKLLLHSKIHDYHEKHEYDDLHYQNHPDHVTIDLQKLMFLL